ncbi:MAG: nuclear transport factor 2 family protein [Myxococcota bacterium]|nr:nuclear transport factor 2 family protein [Myxococcota bacterium]
MLTLEERIERLESTDEIRQLVAKYCVALDTRDLDAMVGLFPADVRVGGGRSGRGELKKWFDETLRVQFTGTAHVTGNHIIEFDDADKEHARGLVYSRNEHETGDAWVIMTMMYWDRYERVEGRWLFRRRLPLYWYASDLNEPPLGEHKMRWPGREPYDGGWVEFWPTWGEFWSSDFDPGRDVAAPAPLGEFLSHLRTNEKELSVRVR